MVFIPLDKSYFWNQISKMQKKTAVFGLIILGFAAAMLTGCFPSEDAKPVYTTSQIIRLLTNDSTKVWFLMNQSVEGTSQSLSDCTLQDSILLTKRVNAKKKNKSTILNDSTQCMPAIIWPISGEWEVLDNGLSKYPQDSIQTLGEDTVQARILLLTTHTLRLTYKHQDSIFEEIYQTNGE